ncbi:hypothetical protein BH20ACT15_BH20ACT15_01590 [soil metagenome]
MNARPIRWIVLAALAAAALGLASCGGNDDESSEAEEQAATPAEAVSEVAETRRGLSQALASYSSGDADAASEQVTETYLQHFELVEGPLEEVDPELTEELEEQIREELVEAIETGEPVAAVRALNAEIDGGLAKASAKLQAT